MFSLCELITGMQVCWDRLKHLGIAHTPRRTTLAHAKQQKRETGQWLT
jgi:hypothetical protein